MLYPISTCTVAKCRTRQLPASTVLTLTLSLTVTLTLTLTLILTLTLTLTRQLSARRTVALYGIYLVLSLGQPTLGQPTLGQP